MIKHKNSGFTLIEITTVVVILATLASAMYIWVVPYMKRSRDVRRVTDIRSYMTIIDVYDKNFDTFPSNYGSGWTSNLGYCLSEMVGRPDYVGFQDMKFQTLGSGTTAPPRDPYNLPSISPCEMTGSYLYSRLDYGASSQVAVIWARMEIRASANYGTGSELVDSGSINAIIAAQKWSITESSPDGIFVVYRAR
jgi:prepilin-type N-terminal cleavage/methylation domain-containing protein